jgi:hypothetical protein
MKGWRSRAGRIAPILVAGLVVLLLGTVSAGWLSDSARDRLADAASIEMALAAELSPSTRSGFRSLGPAEPAWLEAGAYGPVPRIAPDGRRPLVVHARPFDRHEPRPKVALVVAGLGLQDRLTSRAIDLPGAVSLHFSAYATGLSEWAERARASGHEVLLDLPMEPLDYPADDPGPHLLLADNSPGDNLDRLAWLLARAPGYIGLAGSGGRFAGSPQAAAVLGELARRGLGLVELGSDRLAGTAGALALPYMATAAPIDEEPSAAAIDRSLAALEAAALASGGALGLAQAYPVSLERLELWVATLDAKGLALAPVSAFLIERLASPPGQSSHVEPPSRSQG